MKRGEGRSSPSRQIGRSAFGKLAIWQIGIRGLTVVASECSIGGRLSQALKNQHEKAKFVSRVPRTMQESIYLSCLSTYLLSRFTVSMMCLALMPNMSINSSGLPERGMSLTASL